MSAPPTVTNSPTPPLTPDEGDLWFNVLTGRTYVWYIGPSTVGAWVETQPSGGAIPMEHSVPGIVPQPPTATPRDVIRVPEITVSPVPPVAPLVGDLWWSPITGMECVWYDDGNSAQWVQTQPVKYINLATLAGPAGGDLTGMYPNPQIIPGVVLDQPQLANPLDLAADDEHLVSAEWVKGQGYALDTSIPVTLPTRATVNAFLQRPVGGQLGVQLTSVIPGAYVGMIILVETAGFLRIDGMNGPDNGVYSLTNIGDSFNASPATLIPAFSSVTLVPVTGAGTGISVTGSLLTPTINNTLPPPTTLPPSGPAGGALSGTYPNPGLAVPYPTTLPPNGPAGGDLAGTYPNPTLRAGVIPGPPTVPATSVAYGGAGGAITGDATNFTWDSTNKRIGVGTATPAAAIDARSTVAGAKVLSARGVSSSAAQDFFEVIVDDPTGGVGDILVVKGGPGGANPLYQVDRAGDTQVSGWHRALSLSAPIAGGADYFAYYLGNGAGGNLGLFGGIGAPTFSTFGAKGAIYMDMAGAIPWYNVDGGTTWAKVGTGSGGSTITISDTPPGSPTAGALWWNSVLGTLFVYYNDGNSIQWVPAAPSAQTATPTQPVQWKMVDEKVLAVSASAIDLTVPAGCKQFQIDFDLANNGGVNDSLILQVLQGATPYTTADQNTQQTYCAGTTVSAQLLASQTSMTLANAIYYEGRICGSLAPTARTTFYAHAVVLGMQAAARDIRTSEIDNGCLRSTITGFRLRTAISNFLAGSSARATVLA